MFWRGFNEVNVLFKTCALGFAERRTGKKGSNLLIFDEVRVFKDARTVG